MGSWKYWSKILNVHFSNNLTVFLLELQCKWVLLAGRAACLVNHGFLIMHIFVLQSFKLYIILFITQVKNRDNIDRNCEGI